MREELQQALQQCSLHALLMITSGALSRTGFGDVQILDRRMPRQKSRFGGHELVCYAAVGTLPLRLIIKVVCDPIRLRHLDELAGTIDRTGADLGIIASPHALSGGALENRESYSKSRLEILDGPVLTDLLMRCGMGIDDGEVDYAYFEGLELASPRILKCIKELQR